jgi:chromosome segregation ATPase
MPGEPHQDNNSFATVVELRAYIQAEIKRLRDEIEKIFELTEILSNKGAAHDERFANLTKIVDGLPARVEAIARLLETFDEKSIRRIISDEITRAFQDKELAALRDKLLHIDDAPEQRVKRLDENYSSLQTTVESNETTLKTLSTEMTNLNNQFKGMQLKMALIMAGAAWVGSKLLDYVSSLLTK